MFFEQECCREELQRRITSADADEESLKKPWKLPKGNFKHRLLTTGEICGFILQEFYYDFKMII